MKIVDREWIFETKEAGISNVEDVWCKARLVHKSYSQTNSVDLNLNDIFSHVFRHCSINYSLTHCSTRLLGLERLNLLAAVSSEIATFGAFRKIQPLEFPVFLSLAAFRGKK